MHLSIALSNAVRLFCVCWALRNRAAVAREKCCCCPKGDKSCIGHRPVKVPGRHVDGSQEPRFVAMFGQDLEAPARRVSSFALRPKTPAKALKRVTGGEFPSVPKRLRLGFQRETSSARAREACGRLLTRETGMFWGKAGNNQGPARQAECLGRCSALQSLSVKNKADSSAQNNLFCARGLGEGASGGLFPFAVKAAVANSA